MIDVKQLIWRDQRNEGFENLAFFWSIGQNFDSNLIHNTLDSERKRENLGENIQPSPYHNKKSKELLSTKFWKLFIIIHTVLAKIHTGVCVV